jgi:hypothetical protein
MVVLYVERQVHVVTACSRTCCSQRVHLSVWHACFWVEALTHNLAAAAAAATAAAAAAAAAAQKALNTHGISMVSG